MYTYTCHYQIAIQDFQITIKYDIVIVFISINFKMKQHNITQLQVSRVVTCHQHYKHNSFQK